MRPNNLFANDDVDAALILWFRQYEARPKLHIDGKSAVDLGLLFRERIQPSWRSPRHGSIDRRQGEASEKSQKPVDLRA